MRMNSIHPKKLLLTKWTAVKPVARQKHFLVTEVVQPEMPDGKIEWIEIEAVYTKNAQRIHRQELRDRLVWCQGWI